MNYIYEMDVAMLRIQYLMAENWYCRYVQTIIYNEFPNDRTNLEMKYECCLRHKECNEDNCQEYSQCFRENSLQEMVESVRKWAIHYKQSPVEKSPEDGTDSVITA